MRINKISVPELDPIAKNSCCSQTTKIIFILDFIYVRVNQNNKLKEAKKLSRTKQNYIVGE